MITISRISSRKGSKANPPQWFECIEKVSSIRNASDASYARFQSDRVSGVGEYERCTFGCEGVEKVRIGRWGLGAGAYEDFVGSEALGERSVGRVGWVGGVSGVYV